MLVAVVREVHLLALLVRPVVALAFLAGLLLEPRHQFVDAQVKLGALLRRARDDQRRARLVDQDRVDFVDHGEFEPALHAVLDAERKVVAQVVEAELVVGAVRDVGAVRRALLVARLAGLHHADREAEEVENRRHPVCVTLREVLVDRDDVGTLAGQRIQVRGECRDEGLALAGTHFRDLALVQYHAADQLHVEVPESKRAARGLTNHGEGLGQDVVQRLARGEFCAEEIGLGSKLLVRQRLQRRLERVDGLDDTGVLTDEPLVATAENAGEPIGHRGSGALGA